MRRSASSLAHQLLPSFLILLTVLHLRPVSAQEASKPSRPEAFLPTSHFVDVGAESTQKVCRFLERCQSQQLYGSEVEACRDAGQSATSALCKHVQPASSHGKLQEQGQQADRGHSSGENEVDGSRSLLQDDECKRNKHGDCCREDEDVNEYGNCCKNVGCDSCGVVDCGTVIIIVWCTFIGFMVIAMPFLILFGVAGVFYIPFAWGIGRPLYGCALLFRFLFMECVRKCRAGVLYFKSTTSKEQRASKFGLWGADVVAPQQEMSWIWKLNALEEGKEDLGLGDVESPGTSSSAAAHCSDSRLTVVPVKKEGAAAGGSHSVHMSSRWELAYDKHGGIANCHAEMRDPGTTCDHQCVPVLKFLAASPPTYCMPLKQKPPSRCGKVTQCVFCGFVGPFPANCRR